MSFSRIIYRYYTVLLVSAPFFVFSFGSILFDLDPIENNQYLLNDININLLEIHQHESIIFNQSHHLPYGSFIFSHINHFTEIDTLGVKTHFILRRGDYSFRDLTIGTHKINNQDVHFKYFGQVRSFVPTAIPNIEGKNFLQNHMISVIKQTNKTRISSQILYHTEYPDLPISYYWNFSNSNIEESYYHTRESESILWGVKINHQLSEYINISYLHSNHFTNLSQYRTDANNINVSDNYLNHIYYSGFNYFDFIYTYDKKLFIFDEISLFSSFKSNEHEFLIIHDDNNILKDLGLEVGLKTKVSKISLALSYSSKKINIDSDVINNEYYLNTPSLFFSYNINSNSFFSYKLNYINGIYDERIPADLDENYSYSRGLLVFRNQELSYTGIVKKHSIKMGLGGVDLVSIYNAHENREEKDYYSYIMGAYTYLNKYINLTIESRKYLNLNQESTAYSTWIDNYLYYSFKFEYPFKNKPYNLLLGTRGKLLSLKNGGIFINDFPLLCNGSSSRCLFNGDNLLIRHFIDVLFGIEFENFILTYHTVTNNGNDFDLNAPYSDMGTNFPLPEYDFGSINYALGTYSLFHYLKFSWTFFD